MQAKFSHCLRAVSLIASTLLALSGARGDPPLSDAFPVFDNYIKVSAAGSSISGNEAAFQKRTLESKDGKYGIEDLHFTKELDKDHSLEINGRALSNTEDYLAKFLLTKNEVGSLEMGYKSFRTFYDAVGGFFPLNNQWNAMNPEDLHLDRGEFWATAKLARPNLPEFELSIVDGYRKGKKDCTVRGDSDFTGLPNNNPPYSQVRKMVPSFRKLDEHHQTTEGSIKGNIGNTSYRAALTFESTDDIDTRYGTRYPGEVRRFPAPPSTTLLPPASMNNQVTFSQTDGMKTDMFGITATTETVFTEKLSLTTGINYQDLDSDFTGDRPLFTSTPTAVGVVNLPSNNYLNLVGSSAVKIYTGTIALEFKPVPAAFVKLALRGEDKYTSSFGSLTAVTSTVNTTTGAVTIAQSNQIFNSRVKDKSLTPALDMRYTGFKDVALYATASVRNVNGDERYTTPYNPVTTPVPANGNRAANDMSEERTRITVGGTWRASAMFNFRGEVFHKDNSNNAVGYLVRSDGFVDSYDLGYRYNGFKLTGTVKPSSTLSVTTRYVYQEGKATVTGIAVTGSAPPTAVATYPETDSMDMVNHMIAATVDWNPSNQFYMQANANVVFNVINTIYPHAGTAPATTGNSAAPAWDANRVLQNSNNNYVSGSLLAGAVLTKEDDLLVQYTYYRADNYDPQLASVTMPYGAGAEESLVTVGIKHKFSKHLLGTIKLGYIDSQNDTTGGNTNFRGPVGYVTLEHEL